MKESRQLTDESPGIKMEIEKKKKKNRTRRIDYIDISKLGGGLKMSLSLFKYRKVFAVCAYSCYGTSQPTAATSKEVSALFLRSQRAKSFLQSERSEKSRRWNFLTSKKLTVRPERERRAVGRY